VTEEVREIRYIEVTDTKGHFAANLITVKDGVETWEYYDTRVHDTDPDGVIAVFNSATGTYDRCESLAEAKAKFLEHTQRLTYKKTIDELPSVMPQRDINSVIKLNIDTPLVKL